MRALIDLTGQVFGELTVISRASGSGRTRWFCLCSCGKTSIPHTSSLRSGATRSCGHTRGATPTHGMSKTVTYKSWKAMRQRCLNPKDQDFSDYGGRGIVICPEWLVSFEAFFNDMGCRPEDCSLDRIDVDGNYEPENCQWGTQAEQNSNKRPRCASGYLGVNYNKGKWRARITIDGKPRFLGNFATPEEASGAYATAKRDKT